MCIIFNLHTSIKLHGKRETRLTISRMKLFIHSIFTLLQRTLKVAVNPQHASSVHDQRWTSYLGKTLPFILQKGYMDPCFGLMHIPAHASKASWPDMPGSDGCSEVACSFLMPAPCDGRKETVRQVALRTHSLPTCHEMKCSLWKRRKCFKDCGFISVFLLRAALQQHSIVQHVTIFTTSAALSMHNVPYQPLSLSSLQRVFEVGP